LIVTELERLGPWTATPAIAELSAEVASLR
jgi:hypothetical protein